MNRSNNKLNHKKISFLTIKAACRGNPDALKIVISHYTPYIIALSKRSVIDTWGNEYEEIDEEIRKRLEGKLMEAIIKFEI